MQNNLQERVKEWDSTDSNDENLAHWTENWENPEWMEKRKVLILNFMRAVRDDLERTMDVKFTNIELWHLRTIVSESFVQSMRFEQLLQSGEKTYDGVLDIIEESKHRFFQLCFGFSIRDVNAFSRGLDFEKMLEYLRREHAKMNNYY